MSRPVRIFWRDRRGVAAVEFALLAPMLIGLYLGAVELTLALQAQRRMSHMAYAMADMAAQNRTVTIAQLDELMEAGSVMAYPLPTGVLGQRVSSISRSATGAVTVDWVRTRNYTGAQAPKVPDGFLQNGESVVVTDITYDYSSVFGLVMPDGVRFERHAYLRPRLSDQVECPNC